PGSGLAVAASPPGAVASTGPVVGPAASTRSSSPPPSSAVAPQPPSRSTAASPAAAIRRRRTCTASLLTRSRPVTARSSVLFSLLAIRGHHHFHSLELLEVRVAGRRHRPAQGAHHVRGAVGGAAR